MFYTICTNASQHTPLDKQADVIVCNNRNLDLKMLQVNSHVDDLVEVTTLIPNNKKVKLQGHFEFC